MLHSASRASVAGQAGDAHLCGYGLRLGYPDRWIWLHQFKEIYCDNCYRIGPHFPKDPCILDVGANIGMFTLYVKWLYPSARVIAVEPSPTNFNYLRQNLGENQLDDVELIEAVVGKCAGNSLLDTSRDSDAIRVVSSSSPDSICVRSVSLAEIIPDRCVLLKMDIEGSELAALEGAGAALTRVDRLCVEYHAYRNKSSSLKDVLDAIMAACRPAFFSIRYKMRLR